MEESGMTDLQFKSYLRMLIAHLEHIKKAETLEEMREKLAELQNLLQQSLES